MTTWTTIERNDGLEAEVARSDTAEALIVACEDIHGMYRLLFTRSTGENEYASTAPTMEFAKAVAEEWLLEVEEAKP